MTRRQSTFISGITCRGEVGIGIVCGCGHVSAVEMDLYEIRDLIALLQTNLSLAAAGHHRADELRVALFIHDEGHT